MNRASPEKRAEQDAIKSDVEKFLANGGEIEQLEGFGMKPRISGISAVRFALNTEGKVNKKSEGVDASIREDLLAGMGVSAVARKHRVGTSTVTRRKDSLIARGELKLREVQI